MHTIIKNIRININFFVPIALTLVSLVFYLVLTRSVLFTQDELANYFGAISIMDSSSIFYVNSANKEYSTNLIGPSYVTYTSSHSQIYNNFTGTFFIYAFIIQTFGSNHFYFNCILASLSVLLSFLIARKIFKSLISSTLVGIAAAFMPILTVYATSYFNTIFIVFMLLNAVYAILANIEIKWKFLFICLFSSQMFLSRTDVLFSLLPAFVIIATIYLYRIIFKDKSFFSISTLSVVICSILFITYPFLVNYNYSGNIIDAHASSYPYILEGSESTYIKNFNANILDKLIAYFLNTPVGFEGFDKNIYLSTMFFSINFIFGSGFAAPAVIMSTVLLIIYCLDKNNRNPIFTGIIVSIFLTSLITYGASRTYTGFGIYNTRNALVRYFVPFLILSNIALGYLPILMSKVSKKLSKSVIISFSLAILLTVSISTLFDEISYGMSTINKYREDQLNQQFEIQKIIKNEPTALYITDIVTEKYFVPPNYVNISDYNLITYSKFGIYDNTEYYQEIKLRLVDLLKNFHNDDKSVYVIVRSPYSESNFLKDILSNFKITTIKSDLGSFFYKIESQ